MEQQKLIDILLVEDNRTYALLVQEALRDSSLFRILHAQRLSEALLLLSQTTIAVVLLDLGLPDSQGLETLRKLKESAHGIPVIVLTGHNDEQMAVDSVQHGAHEYLVKSQLQEGNLRRTIRHVIERVRTEKALRESEQQLRAIIDTSPQCIKLVNSAGEVLQMNPAGLRMLDVEDDAIVLGKNPSALIAPEDREAYRAFHDSICRGQSGMLEFDIISLKGVRRSLFSTSAPLLNLDGTTLHLAIVQDVSKRKEAEAERRVLEGQLRQSQKMEAIGQLAGGVAHDFNNLLTIILASCCDIQACESLSPKGSETLDNIHQASQRAVALIRQLLAFSRKQLLNPLVLNLNEIITNILKMALRLIGEDIELTWKPLPTLWPVKLDPGQIEQMVVNLLVNARDAMPDGGHLNIETSNVEWVEEDFRSIPERKPGCYVMIRISDDGTGIPPEVQPRIFEPFFTTKEAGQGTGLGLSVVHGIVKQSDGFIEVDSRVNQGTSFTLYFPAVKEHLSIATNGKALIPPKVGTETILLVEDEEGIRKIVRLALEKQGYTVIEAGDGQEALTAAESHVGVFDILLTDMILPVMSGRQLSKLLIARYPGIKVIYMTGYTDHATLRQGLNHDSTAVLQKPFSMSDLIQKVQAVMLEKPRATFP